MKTITVKNSAELQSAFLSVLTSYRNIGENVDQRVKKYIPELGDLGVRLLEGAYHLNRRTGKLHDGFIFESITPYVYRWRNDGDHRKLTNIYERGATHRGGSQLPAFYAYRQLADLINTRAVRDVAKIVGEEAMKGVT